jgi:hypothetical protein
MKRTVSSLLNGIAMRIIPRRKRTWMLVLLAVAILGAASILWTANADKSDFKMRYDRLSVGMTIPEALAVMTDNAAMAGLAVEDQPTPSMQFGWTDDGEHIELTFRDCRLAEKKFRPLPHIERFRRWWTRCFKSKPPF